MSEQSPQFDEQPVPEDDSVALVWSSTSERDQGPTAFELAMEMPGSPVFPDAADVLPVFDDKRNRTLSGGGGIGGQSTHIPLYLVKSGLKVYMNPPRRLDASRRSGNS